MDRSFEHATVDGGKAARDFSGMLPQENFKKEFEMEQGSVR